MQQGQTPQIEIVQYDKNYATIEEITKIFFKNYEQQTNTSSFAGIYGSMKMKYGTILTLTIFLFFILVPSCLQYLIFTSFFSLDKPLALLISLAISLICNYYFFVVYCVNKLFAGHIEFGQGMLKTFTDIKAKYQDKGGNFWLVLFNKEIIGHVALAHDTPEEKEMKGAGKDEKSGYLEMMGINEGYRGMGIGKKLVQTVIDFAERNNYTSIGLGALAVNYPAVELYKKAGFKVIKEIELHRWIGIKAIIMRKKLI